MKKRRIIKPIKYRHWFLSHTINCKYILL